MSAFEELTHRVRTAHGDAWQAQGRLRVAYGGGAAAIDGARLMASGLPEAKWNNADITSSDVAVDELVEWYARRDVPWGIRVPLDVDFALGKALFNKRCFGLVRERFTAFRLPRGVNVRAATPDDLEMYAQVELGAFGGELSVELLWLEPELGAPDFGHWIAEREGRPIATVASVRTDDRAGPATYVSGLALLDATDSDEVARGLIYHVAEDALERGSELIHFNPDISEVRLLEPLGFVEVPGFLVRTVRAS